MQLLTISGNLGRDAELRSTNNDQVLSFSVGVRQGFDREAKSEWFRCSIWGKRAASLKDHLLKGVKVVVVGELKIGEYEGKMQFNVNVRDVEFTSRGEQNARREPDGSRGHSQQSPFDPDLDDSVPFMRSDTVI